MRNIRVFQKANFIGEKMVFIFISDEGQKVVVINDKLGIATAGNVAIGKAALLDVEKYLDRG